MSFYAAHHYVHALLDFYKSLLPPDDVRGLASGRVSINSYAHPRHHGRTPGGTRWALESLSIRRAGFRPFLNALSDMLDDSHAARYGLGGASLVQIRKEDAEEALSQLESIASIAEPHLR